MPTINESYESHKQDTMPETEAETVAYISELSNRLGVDHEELIEWLIDSKEEIMDQVLNSVGPVNMLRFATGMMAPSAYITMVAMAAWKLAFIHGVVHARATIAELNDNVNRP